MPTEGTGAQLRWLHISDLHFRTKLKWSQDVVLSSLLKDIETKHTGAERPDLIFVTGDIAFSGQPDEYELAKEFLLELLKITDLKPERLFIVPGNHDIDRNLEEDAFRGAQHFFNDSDEVDRFFANEGRRKTLFRRQKAFRDFVNDIAPPDGNYADGSFAHTKSIFVGPIKVRALLMDSAWLSEGGANDTGRLLVGERQLIDARSSASETALTFGLLHHPLAWLRDFEQVSIENILLESVNVMLRGHVHSVDFRSIEALENRLTVFTAGAAFESRTSSNSYCSCTLDLAVGLGTCTVHKYIHNQMKWPSETAKQWRLLERSNPSVAIKDCLGVLTDLKTRSTYYLTSLLSGYTSEIPIMIGTKFIFAAFEAEIEGGTKLLSETLINLRHHFYWRPAWEENAWVAEIKRKVDKFEQEIDRLATASAEIKSLVTQQEAKSYAQLNAITNNELATQIPVFSEIEDLCNRGQWTHALAVTSRWLNTDVLNSNQLSNLRRLEMRILIETDVESAAKKVSTLVENEPDAESFFLAARCHYETKDYSSASKYMHLALDKKIDLATARSLALNIAGKVGDKSLTQRVINHE